MRRVLVTASLRLDKQSPQTQKLRFRRLEHIAKRRLGITPLARELRRLRRQQQGQRFLAQQTQRIRCLSSGKFRISRSNSDQTAGERRLPLVSPPRPPCNRP